jgi:hypothetical protein
MNGRAVVSCIALVALLATGCGSAAHQNAAPVTPHGPRQCQGADVAVSFVRDFGVALGNRDGTLVVRNRSHSACTVGGYPGLRLTDAHRKPQPTRVERGPTYFQPDRGPQVVLLVPEARAVANVAWSVEPRPDEPQRKACEPISAWIDVTVPRQRKSWTLPFDESACGHGLLFTTALCAPGELVHPTPLCDGKNLRVGRPSWVSPISQVNMSGVRVTNIGSRSCTLDGWPHVIAVAKGLRSVVAARGADGLTPPNAPPVKLTIRPSGWVSVLFAVSHSCEPMPAHIYDRLVMTIRGRRFAVALPKSTRSANPSFRGFDLRMPVSPTCPPAVSPYVSGVNLPS